MVCASSLAKRALRRAYHDHHFHRKRRPAAAQLRRLAASHRPRQEPARNQTGDPAPAILCGPQKRSSAAGSLGRAGPLGRRSPTYCGRAISLNPTHPEGFLGSTGTERPPKLLWACLRPLPGLGRPLGATPAAKATAGLWGLLGAGLPARRIRDLWARAVRTSGCVVQRR